jgi:hypothetical protein
MKKYVIGVWRSALVLFGLATASPSLHAQYFNAPGNGDLVASFRKEGAHQGTNELVVFLGNVTNFLNQAAGTTMTMNNIPPARLTDSFSSDYTFIQWSVFGANFNTDSPWSTPLGNFPQSTIWYTFPRTDQSSQTTPMARLSKSDQGGIASAMLSIGNGANYISSQLVTTNVNNNTILVREPIQAAYSTYLVTGFMGDRLAPNPALGDFSGNVVQFSFEQTNPSPFSVAVRMDLYEAAPAATARPPTTYPDPITGSTTSVYYVGYFEMAPSGVLTFTRASAAPPAPTITSVSPSPAPGSSFPQQLTISGNNFVSGCTVLLTNTDTMAGSSPAVTFNSSSSLTVSPVFGTVPDNWSATVVNPGNSASAPFAFTVTAPSHPVMSVPKFNAGGTQVTLHGTSGTPNFSYLVLGSPSLTIPVSLWTRVQTNTFASDGSFSTSIPVNPAQPQYFYRIQP